MHISVISCCIQHSSDGNGTWIKSLTHRRHTLSNPYRHKWGVYCEYLGGFVTVYYITASDMFTGPVVKKYPPLMAIQQMQKSLIVIPFVN